MDTIVFPQHPEMGRELAVSELTIGQVVMIWAEHRPAIALTLNVAHVGEMGLALIGVKVKLTLILFRRPDDTVVDDQGRRIRLYEYLGA